MARAGLDWREYVKIEPRYFRPAEVDLLLADPTKANTKLGRRQRSPPKGLAAGFTDDDVDRYERSPVMMRRALGVGATISPKESQVSRRAMVHQRIGNIFVLAHTQDGPDAAEWNAYLDDLERRATNVGAVRTLVVTEGGGPDTRQRTRLNEILAGAPTLAAIVTDSLVARGIVTALGWFNPDIRPFSLASLSEAMRYLGLTDGEARAARATVNAARAILRLPRLPDR